MANKPQEHHPMNVTTSAFGVPGERDADGFFGYYTIGTQYIFANNAGFLLALQLNSAPYELIFYAGRLHDQGPTFPHIPADEPFLQEAVRHALVLPDIRQVYMLRGELVPVATVGAAGPTPTAHPNL